MRRVIFTILLGCFLALIFLFPVIIHINTSLPSREDGVLIGYLITQQARTIVSGNHTYDLPFYYPYSNTLTYSDPFLSTALLSLPLLTFTQNLVFISNWHLLWGTLFAFLAMTWLVYEITEDLAASWLAATLFTFSPWHFGYIVHLHTYLLAGIPLCLLGVIKYARTHRLLWLVMSVITFLYQTLNAPLTGFFLLCSIPFLLLDSSLRHRLQEKSKLVLFSFIATLSLCAYYYLPYFQTSQTFGYVRTIRDTAHFGRSINFFASPEAILTYILIGLLSLARRKESLTVPSEQWLKIGCVLAVVGGMFMLGPVLKLHDTTFKVAGIPLPLPYALFYYLVPGFKAFRDVGRWVIVFNLGVSLFLGYVAARSYLSFSTKLIWLVGLVACLWFYQLPTLKLYPIPITPPPIYQLVKDQPEGVLAEFPSLTWRMMPFAAYENDRLMYQLRHGQTLFNGVSGFTPPLREEELNWLWQHFPAAESIDWLKQHDVTLILVHLDQYDQMKSQNFRFMEQPARDSEVIRLHLNAHPDLLLLGLQPQRLPLLALSKLIRRLVSLHQLFDILLIHSRAATGTL